MDYRLKDLEERVEVAHQRIDSLMGVDSSLIRRLEDIERKLSNELDPEFTSAINRSSGMRYITILPTNDSASVVTQETIVLSDRIEIRFSINGRWAQTFHYYFT